MAKDRRAPKAFGKVNRLGVPMFGVFATAIISTISFLSSPNGDSVVYTWLYNATGLTGFITWLGICVSHIRFRRAFKVQGLDVNRLKFKAKLYPVGTWIALAICVLVILGQSYWAVSSDGIDWSGMLVAFIGLPIAIALWLIYKYVKKEKLIPLDKIDLSGGEVLTDVPAEAEAK